MKYTIVSLLVIISTLSIRAQNNPEAQYIEIIPQVYTWKFRTSPTGPFLPIGFLGENLRPYMNNNLAAEDAFNEYQRGQKMYIFGVAGGVAGLSFFTYGLSRSNDRMMLASLAINTVSSIVMISGLVKAQTHLYEAIDLHNFNKSPVSSNLLPKIKPSSHSVGVGLVWDIK